MAAIGSIRKHGVLLMIIIGFALLLFLLTGLFDNNTLYRIFASKQFTRAKIDGTVVDEEYNTLNVQLGTLMKMLQRKTSFDENDTYQIHQLAWEQLINEYNLEKELGKLGFVFTPEMIENIMFEAKMSLATQQPNPYMAEYFQFLAERGGPEWAQSVISSIEDLKDNPNAADIYGIYEAIVRRYLYEYQMNVYLTLSRGSIYYSDVLAENIKENNVSLLAEVASFNSFIPALSELPVTITDKEMKDWFKKHKDRYVIKEDMRNIDIAIFPIVPTTEDQIAIENEVNELYEEFAGLSVVDTFNIRHSYSFIDSSYHKSGDYLVINTKNGYMQFNPIEEIDSMIFERPVGTNIQPINIDESAWFFGKSFGVAHRPDSMLVALLIVDFKSSQNQASVRTKSQARKEADSLRNLIETGQATIFDLTPDYLGGRNAVDTTFWIEDNTNFLGLGSPSLYTKLLNLKPGTTYRDDLPGGFVVYQVLAATQPIEKRQYVLYANEITPSDATVNMLRSKATQLAASSTSAIELLENANNEGIQVISGKDIRSMQASVAQLNSCRAVVSWAFGENVVKDAVSDVFKLESGVFAVATVTGIKEKGTPKFEDVKLEVEAELQSVKKIEAIAAKLNEEIATGATIASLAEKYNVNVSDSASLNFIFDFYQNAGMENIAVAKVFENPVLGKNQVVSGKTNVYLVNVKSTPNKASSPTTNLSFERNILQSICLGRSRSEMLILDGLKDKINIWDNRARFYIN